MIANTLPPIKTYREHFIQKMAPAVKKANDAILAKRNRVIWDMDHYRQLSKNENQWLAQLAKTYDVKNAHAWGKLMNRVDIVPASLAIAQAINESAWGRSRFAKQGNNFYGQWCYTKGCGLVPKKRPKVRAYEVQTFKNREASVAAYMHNLNTHGVYQNFRDARHDLHRYDQPISGLSLVPHLTHYSTRRQAYVRSISQVIMKYGLEKYDLKA